MIINTFSTAMTPEETTLLNEAIEKWNNPNEFTDEKVKQVKAVFSRLMHGKSVKHIPGSQFPEGIVLQDKAASKPIFYTLLYGNEGWKCRSFALEAECSVEFYTLPDVSFMEYLSILSHSERRQMAQGC